MVRPTPSHSTSTYGSLCPQPVSAKAPAADIGDVRQRGTARHRRLSFQKRDPTTIRCTWEISWRRRRRHALHYRDLCVQEPQRRHFNAIMIGWRWRRLSQWWAGYLGVCFHCGCHLLRLQRPQCIQLHRPRLAPHTRLGIMHHLYGIPLCLSSQRLLGCAFVPIMRRGVLRWRLPCTAWSPGASAPPALWARRQA